MQSRKFITLFVVLIFLSGILSTSAYAGSPEPEKGTTPNPQPLEISLSAPRAGIESIGGSTLQIVTPAYLPIGTPFDLCFGVFVQSPDVEYMDHVDVDLPDTWSIDLVASNSVPVANGCSSALPPVFGVSAGNVVFWQSRGYPPQTGCGAWNGGQTGILFNFCANVTIPDVSGAPWMLPWNYVGDGFGSTPHEISGSYGPIGPVEPLMLHPAEIHTMGCPSEPQVHTISVQNNTSDAMSVDLEYILSTGLGSCTGPASVVIPANDSAGIDVSLTAGSFAGSTVICDITAVDAADPANNDTSQIIEVVESCYWDPAGWQLEPIVDASPNQWAAGVVGTHPAATGLVGYVIGGLGAGSSTLNPDLQMYDPQSSTWTQLPDLLNPRFSPVAGWIDGLLYAAGGYDAGFVSTNDLQVFDPAAGTWDNMLRLDMPNSRGGGAGGVGTCSYGAGECLFHVGGGPDSSFANTTLETWEYNPIVNTWTLLDPKPAGASPDGHILGAGVGCGGKIYIGGDYRGYDHFFTLDATQPAGSQWTQLANIPANAGSMTPALVCEEASQSIYLIGGDPDGAWGTYNDTVYIYEIATDTWHGPMPQTLQVNQLGSVGWYIQDTLWSVGGTVGSGAISPMPFESLQHVFCEFPKPIYLPLILK